MKKLNTDLFIISKSWHEGSYKKYKQNFQFLNFALVLKYGSSKAKK